jgi:mRNA interferase MazF
MNKDYSLWTPVKKEINNKKPRFTFKVGEVWITSVGENVGFEEDGKGKSFNRPVLILKKFNKFLCHVVPLSTTEKRGKYYFEIDTHTNKYSVALLSQNKTIDSLRLFRKIGFVSKETLFKVRLEIAKNTLEL